MLSLTRIAERVAVAIVTDINFAILFYLYLVVVLINNWYCIHWWYVAIKHDVLYVVYFLVFVCLLGR